LIACWVIAIRASYSGSLSTVPIAECWTGGNV
jgi:hypothetical protein